MPGDVILRTYDLVRALRDAGVATVGGFHTPMEKECLTLLLRGRQPVIGRPAGHRGERVPFDWKQRLAEGRLLIASPLRRSPPSHAESSRVRNLFVAQLAGAVFRRLRRCGRSH